MVTTSNGQVLPDLPAADSKRRRAPARADSLPPSHSESRTEEWRAAIHEHEDALRAMSRGEASPPSRWTLRALPAVLSGDSLLYARPVSLADMWAGHQQAAGHYNAWLAKWPRYAWGAFHTALTAVLYALVWVAESPPRLAVAVGVVLGCWFWS